jgi:3-oxoacyl-[acyl-carrier protein] reductase
MKKILILGGNSDIGLELLNNFLNDKNFLIHIHYSKKISQKIAKKEIKLIKKDLSKIDSKNLNKYFDSNYDIIVNLVGYVSNQSFSNFSIKEIQKTILVNSLIPFAIIRNSLKNMIKNKFGRIINTSSIGVKFGGGVNTFSYSLSKHLNEFMPSEIKNLSANNILYNTVRIGVTDTKFHKKIRKKSLQKRIKLIPLKKMATTRDIARYITYLIIENNFITNEVINITGGE